MKEVLLFVLLRLLLKVMLLLLKVLGLIVALDGPWWKWRNIAFVLPLGDHSLYPTTALDGTEGVEVHIAAQILVLVVVLLVMMELWVEV